MVPEVVVAVGDGDVEDDSSEEFDQVSVHIGAVPGYPVHQFEITGAGGGIGSIGIAELGHGRCIMQPAAVVLSVEPLC